MTPIFLYLYLHWNWLSLYCSWLQIGSCSTRFGFMATKEEVFKNVCLKYYLKGFLSTMSSFESKCKYFLRRMEGNSLFYPNWLRNQARSTKAECFKFLKKKLIQADIFTSHHSIFNWDIITINSNISYFFYVSSFPCIENSV